MEINFKLLPATIKVIKSPKPTTLFIGGRGSAKSFTGGLWLVLNALKEPGYVWGACAPTHSQSSAVVLPNITRHLDSLGLPWVYNKTPPWLRSRFSRHDGILSVKTPRSEYSSQIFIGSAEKFDFWRGREFAGLWADEIRDFREDAIKVILACLRGFGDKNRIFPKLFTTTPNGFDSIYKEYIEPNRPDVEIIRSASNENIFLPKSFFEELKANYSEKFYRQEVLGEILNFTVGQVVTSFDRNINVTSEPLEGDYFLSCDFNLCPMSWVYGRYTKNRAHFSGELVSRDVARTSTSFHEFVSKFPEVKGKRLYVYGDSSGRARTTKSHKTDYELIREAALDYSITVVDRSLTKNPSHADRINVFNSSLEKGILTFDPACEQLFTDFYNAVWKEGTREINKSKYDPHSFDAASYFVYKEFGAAGTRVSNLNF